MKHNILIIENFGGDTLNCNSEYHMLLICEKNIRFYQQMMETSNNSYQRVFYENLLNVEKDRYYQLYYQYHFKKNMSNNEEYEIYKSGLRQFTNEELSQYDGSNGRPAYVAVNGIVYDVSLEATWGGGTHFSIYAGHDLTAQFNGCHLGRTEILGKLPQIGLLIR